MANSPVDVGDDFIKSGMVLITSPAADKYLKSTKAKPNEPPSNRLSRQCGGKNGFDDYVERWE
jgi:hypothetical protein